VGAMPTPMNSYITSLLPSASNSASTRQPSKQRLQQARLRGCLAGEGRCPDEVDTPA
jgi:hypothetical protein